MLGGCKSWKYKLEPIINCVPDVVISCDESYLDLSITGAPGAYTPCGESEVVYEDISVILNSCGLGKVIRRWKTVADNLPICDQNINIIPLDPISEDRISFPEDLIVTCIEDVNIENPIIIGGACDQVGFSIQSDTFRFDNGACYKILNEYTVIDWCQYDPNNSLSDGKWSHLQTIKVIDETDPVITSCQNQFVDVSLVDCTTESFIISAEGQDEGCGSDPFLRWFYNIDIDFDDVTDISGQLIGTSVDQVIYAEAQDSVKVQWTVSDGCGNSYSCTQILYFRDNKAPTPYCHNVAISVSSEGTVEVWASDFNVGSTDNCTSNDQLKFSFSGTDYIPSKTFSCDDIENGVDQSIDVEIWVWDNEGNKDFCLARLDLQDNGNYCPDAADAKITIAGILSTEYGEPLEDAIVVLESNGPEYPYEKITGQNGYFEFNGNPINADYSLSAINENDPLNGVSTLDLVLIQRHILGLGLLDSPYKVIASDINNNLKVSASDILELRRTILGINDKFPSNSSWRFVDRTKTFDDFMRPFPFEEAITYEDLKVSKKSSDFVAVKIGDVNGNADANLRHRNITVRSDQDIVFNYDIQSKGNGVAIPVYLNEEADIHGFQLKLENISSDKMVIESGQMNFSEDNYFYSNDVLTISWDGTESGVFHSEDPLFTIIAEKASIASLIKAEDTYTEIYVTPALNIHNITLEKRNIPEVIMSVSQNEPNPFNDQTTIYVDISTDEQIVFEVLDGKGTRIVSETHQMTKGRNKILFVNDDRLAPGVYYYKVITSFNVITKKMVVVR